MKTTYIRLGSDNKLMQEESCTVKGFLFTIQKKKQNCIMHVHTAQNCDITESLVSRCTANNKTMHQWRVVALFALYMLLYGQKYV